MVAAVSEVSPQGFWITFAGMSAIRQAQQIFDAGVLSLGLMVDGQQAAKNLEYARAAFRRATELDPEMCDAWLGRAAAGI